MRKDDVMNALRQSTIERCFRKLIWIGWGENELAYHNLRGRGGIRSAINQEKFKAFTKFTLSKWNAVHPTGDPLHISFSQKKKTLVALNCQMSSLCQRATKMAREKSKYDGISSQVINREVSTSDDELIDEN